MHNVLPLPPTRSSISVADLASLPEEKFLLVGPKLNVIGIDIDLPLILRDDQENEGQGNMSFSQGDIMDLATKHGDLGNESFDCVFSRYSNGLCT